ncbi:hypothetical protein [Caenimonas sp. SL110]|uniref:hypothetical protein n=1 Tax=Caenimonas sp. SL110 TaxID=1450524 RepID=UPI000654A44D|nr:hypothetical protein [Caenimonas sp. SL110]
MASAAQKLAEFGITMEQANAWLLAQTDPAFIVSVFAMGGITNEMIGEIAGYPGAPYTPLQVRAFFGLYGVDSTVLDPAPIVVSVSDANVMEGTALQHTVTLSGATTEQTEYSLNIMLGSAAISDFSGFSLSNGVQLASFTSILVPAGVNSFTFTLNSANDSSDEPNEGYSMYIGGVFASGIITDNDEPVVLPPVVQELGNASATEGGLVEFPVFLSKTSDTPTSLPFTLVMGTAAEADLGAVTATNGVTIQGANVVVPAGVQSFHVRVATVNDTADEAPSETFTLNLGTMSATGTVLDDDEPVVVPPTVQTLGAASATEGALLEFPVFLSAAGTIPTSLPFSLAMGTAAQGDLGALTATNGVTIQGGNVVVPAGVQSFHVRVATVDDSTDEDTAETFTFNLGTLSATGTVLDNDDTPPPADDGIFSDNMMELVQLLQLNNRTGVLSNASLKAEVIKVTGEAAYLATFTPDSVDGGGDGVWTPDELGFSHLGTLPATVATVESLFYGTYLHIFTSIDQGEAVQLSNFVLANQVGLESGDAGTYELYVDLILDVMADPAPPLVSDAMLAQYIMVPVIVEMVNIVGAGQDLDIFDYLPIG